MKSIRFIGRGDVEQYDFMMAIRRKLYYIANISHYVGSAFLALIEMGMEMETDIYCLPHPHGSYVVTAFTPSIHHYYTPIVAINISAHYIMRTPQHIQV